MLINWGLGVEKKKVQQLKSLIIKRNEKDTEPRVHTKRCSVSDETKKSSM